jgi:hypothetical protein
MADAVIIPFPQRSAPAAGPEGEYDRLQTALLQLQAALDDQRRAVSEWRFAMAELGIGVAGLGHSMAGYQDALGNIDGKLNGLRTEALKLESWADGVVASGAGAATS